MPANNSLKLLSVAPPAHATGHEGKILDLNETARIIKRTPSAVRNLVMRGKIPFRKAAGRLVFFEHELLEWIQSSPEKTLAEVLNDERS